MNHLMAILKAAKEAKVPHAFVHFFGDGRDTAPKSAGIQISKHKVDVISFLCSWIFTTVAPVYEGN
jgi:bisphosphoglycerate-independent phosphoglycerate mutase (AlkP superfamily)